MKTDVQARNFLLTDALQEFVTRRIDAALGHLDTHVRKVSVRLSDINGPRGGVDKHCHVQVALHHLPDVVIEDVEADMYLAITRATDRAGRNVARRLDRQRQHRPAAAGLNPAVETEEDFPAPPPINGFDGGDLTRQLTH